jgi:hypothetical protein
MDNKMAAVNVALREAVIRACGMLVEADYLDEATELDDVLSSCSPEVAKIEAVMEAARITADGHPDGCGCCLCAAVQALEKQE